jgi:hypothetical protein
MDGPSTSELLTAWERGLGCMPAARALILLATGDDSEAEIAALTIGERDGRLLELRRWAFGADVTGAAECPSCGLELELPFTIDQLRAAPADMPAEDVFEADGYRVRFRVPRGVDVLEAAATGSLTEAERVLLDRCVPAVERDGTEVAVSELPAPVLDRLQAELAVRDPQADIELALVCPECDHRCSALFDIGQFMWTEVDQWARRLLVDVATLAAAFGWTEAEVLRLGPARREAYLELAG